MSALPATIGAAAATGNSPGEGRRFYLPELDALRFFAFLAVFIRHSFPEDLATYSKFGFGDRAAGWVIGTVRTGAFGVDLFFMLSSFLITALLIREHDRTGTIDLRGFWIRRCLRIWPLYFFFVALAAFVLPSWLNFIPAATTADQWGLLTFTYNWVMAFRGVGQGSPILILWSVSLEEQFYLTWPLLLAFAGVGRLRGIALGMIAFSAVARVIAVAFSAPALFIWGATLVRLEPIALGALLALAIDRMPRFAAGGRLAMIGAGLLATLLPSLAHWGGRWNDIIKFPAAAVGCLLILVGVVGSEFKTLRIKPLIYLGKISYGLYVFHLLAIQLSSHLPIPSFPFSRIVASFLLTVVLAALSYRLLETPFLRLKDRFAHVQSRPV